MSDTSPFHSSQHTLCPRRTHRTAPAESCCHSHSFHDFCPALCTMNISLSISGCNPLVWSYPHPDSPRLCPCYSPHLPSCLPIFLFLPHRLPHSSHRPPDTLHHPELLSFWTYLPCHIWNIHSAQPRSRRPHTVLLSSTAFSPSTILNLLASAGGFHLHFICHAPAHQHPCYPSASIFFIIPSSRAS